MSPREQRFLAFLDRVSLRGALTATVIALIVGVLLASTLTRPLRELTAAIRSMARGELGPRGARALAGRAGRADGGL